MSRIGDWLLGDKAERSSMDPLMAPPATAAMNGWMARMVNF